MVQEEIQKYNKAQDSEFRDICETLAELITKYLPDSESKIWHGSPVWFLDGNPVTGYSKLKDSVQLLFWSGQSFDEPLLQNEGKFKAAEIRYKNLSDVVESDVKRWLKKANDIQWDYKNIVKRKGVLERI